VTEHQFVFPGGSKSIAGSGRQPQEEASEFTNANPLQMGPTIALDGNEVQKSLDLLRPSLKRKSAHRHEDASRTWHNVSEELLLLLASDDTREGARETISLT